MKTILNKKVFFLFFLLGAISSIQGQTVIEEFCQGTGIRNYAVDSAEGINGTPGSTYAWSVTGTNSGTAILSTSTGNPITIDWSSTPAGNYVVHVLETNSGCPATEVLLDVIISPIVTASVSITASSNPICAGSSITFTAAPTNGGANPSYQWYVGSTAVGTNSQTFTSSLLSNNDVVSVVMTSNASPCLEGSPATSNAITVTVNPILTASVSIASPSNTFCAGTSVTFNATPTNGGTTPSFQWYVGSTAVGTNSQTFTSSSLSNNDVVSVVMTSNASPCLIGSPATSNAITVTVNPILTASVSIAASSNPICAGSSITFTAASTNGGADPSYQWYVGSTAVGINSQTFTSSLLSNNDVVTVVMTSNASPCLTGSPATSSSITINVTTVTTSAIFHD